MATLKSNVTFSCNDEGFSPEEKLTVLNNEAQCSQYTEEEYDEAVYGKGISKYDLGMQIIDAMEEEYSTNLPPEYMEAGVDAGLREFVRLVHANAQCDVYDKDIANYDKLDDVMSMSGMHRDKKKFAVMKTNDIQIEYHHTPGGGMFSTRRKVNTPGYKRKVIWNEEGNFEDIDSDDKPEWLIELIDFQDDIKDTKKMEHKTKILWKIIRETRAKYKKCYALMEKYQANGLLSYAKLYKDRGDEAYKEYKYYSNAMDKIKQLDAKIEYQHKEFEADELLSLFVELQQKCPDELVDSVLREDIKAKYKKEGFERTRYYLVRLIRRCEVLQQQKKYEEEEETA